MNLSRKVHFNLIVATFAGANIHGAILITATVITTSTVTTTFTAPVAHIAVDHPPVICLGLARGAVMTVLVDVTISGAVIVVAPCIAILELENAPIPIAYQTFGISATWIR